MRLHMTAALITAALMTLAACGGDTSPATQTDPSVSEATHNDADVRFGQQMIPHHRQALEMAELAETRASDPAVRDLAAQIKAAQDPEIETMSGWLESWGEEVPMDGMAGMEGMEGMEGTDDVEGMMSEAQMSKLEDSTGRQLDRLFLTMMIAHHQGAIDMARTEQEEGEYPDAVSLAEQIEQAQTAEIATMEALLGR